MLINHKITERRMNKRTFIIAIVLASFIGGLIAVGAFSLFYKNEPQYNSFEERQNVKFKNIALDPDVDIPNAPNFVYAASLVTPGVVHIKTIKESSGNQYYNPFEDFFNMPGRRPQESSGSGVIISDDGYIATNYHVIEGASEIEITLDDNRKYKAEIVGEDPTTDLALLRIDEVNLQFIRYGDSDNLQIGEWVLAVGNPFQLTSTVTAGIVSAKARNINILRNRGEYNIESFIQTDAVVNPGNSGGALVNLKGELVGLNTAIASPTGSYAGYSFAVPVALVKKVMDDLLEYGSVQRALLGISITNVDADLAKDLGIDETSGVYVSGVNKGTAAEEAGLEAKDVIIAIDNAPVKNVAELQEYVARHRPGDKIEVTYIRNGKRKKVTAKLKNVIGEERMYSRTSTMELQGADIVEIDDKLKKELDLSGGVQLNNIRSGKWKDAGIQDGFIITSIDKREIKTINDLMGALANKSGGILIGGVYPNGDDGYYGVKWN